MVNSDAKSELVQSHLVEIYIKPQQTFLDKVQTKEKIQDKIHGPHIHYCANIDIYFLFNFV